MTYPLTEEETALIVDKIDNFDAYCSAREATDTNEVWDILYWIRGACLGGDILNGNEDEVIDMGSDLMREIESDGQPDDLQENEDFAHDGYFENMEADERL